MSKNGTVQNLEHCFKIASHETDNLVKRLKLQFYSTSVSIQVMLICVLL